MQDPRPLIPASIAALYILISLLCISPSLAYAAADQGTAANQGAAAAAPDDLQLGEIVIKGQEEPIGQESLTMKEVKESPARDIGEALEQVPGINIVHRGAIANDVVLRGLQHDNINVFLDGVRIQEACPGHMDPPAFHFDFAEVEKVNIIKGPYDLTNPGGIGGVINAVSKEPSKGFSSDLSVTGGSYGSVDASATASYGTDLFDGLVGYDYKQSLPPVSGDGKRITDIYPSTNMNRYKSSAIDSRAYQMNTGWLKLGMNPSADSRMELSYSRQDAEHVLYPYLNMDSVYDRTNTLNWTYRVEKVTPLVSGIKLQAYWDDVDHLMDNSLRQGSMNMHMSNLATTRVYGAKVDGSIEIGPGTLTAGTDYYNRNWDVNSLMLMMGHYTSTDMIPDVFVDNLGFFAGYELPLLKSVTLKGGVRTDHTWVNADGTTNKPKSNVEFASVGGNVQLAWKPVEHLEASLGFGSGVRTPDPQELFINKMGKQQGNVYLKPARNNEVDLGAKYATDRFFVNVSVFNSSLQDYINLERLGGMGTTATFNNIDANIWGAEMGSQVALPYDLFLKGSLTYEQGENLTGDRPLSEMPPLKGTVAVRYDVDTWFVEAAENLASSQHRVDKELQETPTAGWATTDLKAGYKYKRLSIYAGIYNLLDKYYYSYLSYQRDPFATGVKVPENGRNFYVTVAYRF
jgi:iron complex outermembrane recepter protein